MPSTVFELAEMPHMERAIALALEAEAAGNLPVGAVLVLDGVRVAEGRNAILVPELAPGRHAEIEALRALPSALWRRASELTLYTTLEPCMMCMGAALLHGIGRVVYGATDVRGGAGVALRHLPAYYDEAPVPLWMGPVAAERCDPLYHRVAARFRQLQGLG